MERRITIEEAGIYKEDYQMKMLQAGEPEGLLPVKARGMNGSSFYDYDVSGKISFQAMYERSKIQAEDIRLFLRQFQTALSEVRRYLLDINRILLKPEYLFYEDGKVYFCYYPPFQGSLWEEFHGLTEYFVKQADYEDKECIRMVFLLHKGTMEENYSLEKLIAECLKKEERPEEEKKNQYDTQEHDWITSQEMGSLIMEETENMWTPVRRFLRKHKKPKWGDWDGLYIEEEEL
ncbi:hypothetical protein FND36_00285 [Lachnospiraceae bacterium KGMB03038]|nr:hypothetical protein FND36_00285 [Lachnospiraceae bacterium KGMB03038]